MTPGLAFGVRSSTEEIDDDAFVVSEYPRVVAGTEIHRDPGTVLHFRSVVRDDFHSAGNEVAQVLGLTAVGLRDGFDSLRPFPARLEVREPDLRAAQAYDIDFSVGEGSRLVRTAKRLLFSGGPSGCAHACSLRRHNGKKRRSGHRTSH